MPEIASLFVRVHKSFIVNTNSVRAFNKADNGYVELDTGQSIPIGDCIETKFWSYLTDNSMNRKTVKVKSSVLSIIIIMTLPFDRSTDSFPCVF